MLKIATICSGIGAPEKALRNLGIDYKLAYFCEFDKFAATSYKAIHDELNSGVDMNLGDLTKVNIESLPHNLDLIVGGTPCQDFSLAGKRAGAGIDQNTRSSLMWNFIEIIRKTQPKTILWENVPGCLTGAMKNNYNKFINTLSEIGYKVYSEILNSKNFGIPQNRDRVFVLAIRKDLGLEFEMPKGYDCGIRLKDVLETFVDNKYFISQRAIEGMLKTKFTQSSYDIVVQDGNDVCNTLCARDYKAPKCIDTNKLLEITSGQSQGNRVYDPSGVSVTLSANGGGMGAKNGLRIEFNNLSPTLDTRCDCLGVVVNEPIMYNPYNNAIIKDFAPTQTTISGNINSSATVLQISENEQKELQIRKLTPKECYRLMGFSDEDFDKVKSVEMSDSQCYKQAGNSIVVNVLMAIFGQLYKIDWKPKVYGKWWKSETERLLDLPLFQLINDN